LVIGIVNILAVLAIILTTLVGARSGYELASSYLVYFGVRGEDARTWGVIFGGILGFLASAIPAVVVFALTEIANNTRQTLLELRRSNNMHSGGAQVHREPTL
jgi:hypothetical protein